jgi:FixJ family two-component response regulator
MPNKPRVVAVIDDNLTVLGAMGRLLSALGYRTELYVSGEEFLAVAALSEAICLIVDVHLGESSGIELAKHLAKIGYTTPIVFMSADGGETAKKRAAETGCIAFLTKPFGLDDLIGALAQVPDSRPFRAQ